MNWTPSMVLALGLVSTVKTIDPLRSGPGPSRAGSSPWSAGGNAKARRLRLLTKEQARDEARTIARAAEGDFD
jgi:hypothetical protein